MGILAQRFPDDIAAGAEGGHGDFSLTIVEHQGGFETVNLDWPMARGRWNVARAIEFLDKHEEARAHYYKARAGFHQFRMKDYADYIAQRTGNTKGRLTGSGTTWQIGKVYGADEPTFEYVCPLYRLVAGSQSIWRSGTLQIAGTDYTINNDTGLVTSAASWTAGTLETAFQFDVLCRYETRHLRSEVVFKFDDTGRMLLRWADIEIVEVREVPA